MTSATLLALTLVLVPQGSDGNLLATPETLFVDSATAANNQLGNAADGWLKTAGLKDTIPSTHPPQQERPDFSPAVVPWAVPGLVVNGFSTNLNWVASADNIATATADDGQGWAGVVFSISRGTVGLPGSRVAQEVATGDYSADTFQYLFPDSVGAPPASIGQVRRPVDGDEVELVSGSGLGAIQPDITAMDLFVPYLLGSPVVFAELHNEFIGVVFTVSKATLGAAPSQWWNGTIPSAATLLVSLWNAQTRVWSLPAPYVLPSELGLAPGNDVNAVAWDLKRKRMLFSSDDLTQDPIMYFDLLTRNAPLPFLLPDYTPLSAAIGLGPTHWGPVRIDDPDALCAIDPRVDGMGLGVAKVRTIGSAEIYSSMFRSGGGGGGGDLFVTTVSAPSLGAGSGWAVLATAPPRSGIKASMLQQPASRVLALQPFRGRAMSNSWPAPAGLRGASVTTQWQLVDPSGASLGAAASLTMRY
ncbi:MAG: hypothetical protein AAF628_07850 [Planctomycetota bacterium]